MESLLAMKLFFVSIPLFDEKKMKAGQSLMGDWEKKGIECKMKT